MFHGAYCWIFTHAFHFTAAIALTGLSSGTNSLTWVENYQCSGYESRLADCSLGTQFQLDDCINANDAGVSCSGTTCTEGDIRLRGGTSTTGRVEICFRNVWGTVCDDSWSPFDARVVCVQLGLPSSGIIRTLHANKWWPKKMLHFLALKFEFWTQGQSSWWQNWE